MKAFWCLQVKFATEKQTPQAALEIVACIMLDRQVSHAASRFVHLTPISLLQAVQYQLHS